MLVALDEVGITYDVLADVGHNLLHAKRQKAQYDAKEGKWSYSKPLSDNTTQYNTLKLLMDFHNVMPAKQLDITDQRQTRYLASMLFAKIEEAGMLGQEDMKRVGGDGPMDAEFEIMEASLSSHHGPVSLCPLDMEDD